MTDGDTSNPYRPYARTRARHEDHTGNPSPSVTCHPSQALAQESCDRSDDVVIGYIRKNTREAIEVRLRTISQKHFVLLRLCREDRAGEWRPLASNCRCGLSVRADHFSALMDACERAEDALADEGVIR